MGSLLRRSPRKEDVGYDYSNGVVPGIAREHIELRLDVEVAASLRSACQRNPDLLKTTATATSTEISTQDPETSIITISGTKLNVPTIPSSRNLTGSDFGGYGKTEGEI